MYGKALTFLIVFCNVFQKDILSFHGVGERDSELMYERGLFFSSDIGNYEKWAA